jgi:hypothetical protein
MRLAYRSHLYQAFQVGQGVIREIDLRCRACPEKSGFRQVARSTLIERFEFSKNPRFGGVFNGQTETQASNSLADRPILRE